MYYMAGIQEEKTDDIMKLRLLISIRSTTETQPSLEGKIIQLVVTLCQCLEKTQGRDKIDQGDARKIIGIYTIWCWIKHSGPRRKEEAQHWHL